MTNMLNTDLLWNDTHAALCAKEWSKARALLDDLCQRHDVRDYLASATAYGLPKGDQFTQSVQDRIELVNAHVDACRSIEKSLDEMFDALVDAA